MNPYQLKDVSIVSPRIYRKRWTHHGLIYWLTLKETGRKKEFFVRVILIGMKTYKCSGVEFVKNKTALYAAETGSAGRNQL